MGFLETASKDSLVFFGSEMLGQGFRVLGWHGGQRVIGFRDEGLEFRLKGLGGLTFRL